MNMPLYCLELTLAAPFKHLFSSLSQSHTKSVDTHNVSDRECVIISNFFVVVSHWGVSHSVVLRWGEKLLCWDVRLGID